jgi:hypothetical protein
MKFVAITVAAISFLVFPVGTQATTCERLAQNCIKNGGTHARCFEPVKIAHCKKTCELAGPYTGKMFYATEGCGTNRKKK